MAHTLSPWSAYTPSPTASPSTSPPPPGPLDIFVLLLTYRCHTNLLYFREKKQNKKELVSREAKQHGTLNSQTTIRDCTTRAILIGRQHRLSQRLCPGRA